VEIGIGKGKKLHDRRQDIKQREERRDIAREFKSKRIKVWKNTGISSKKTGKIFLKLFLTKLCKCLYYKQIRN